MDKPIVWTWVRHASAAPSGCFCGSSNPPLAPGADFSGVARLLPKSCAVFVSPLLRATQTLEGLTAAGFAPKSVIVSPLIVEQDFGTMEGQPYRDVRLPEDAGALAAWRPPGGENFNDVVTRVRRFIADAGTANREICVIAHAGVIRAALAIARDLTPGAALSLGVEPLSATRLAINRIPA